MTQQFSLAKAEVFSLEKLQPGIKDIYIGLDWDPAEEGADVDLDAVLIGTNADGKIVAGKEGECFLFYNNHGRDGTSPSGYSITEDNRDGVDVEGATDDEAIFIKSENVDADIVQMHVYVTYHEANGKTLKDVSRIGLRIAELVNDGPSEGAVATYDVRDAGEGEGALMCTLARNTAGGWDVVAKGESKGNLNDVALSHGIAL